MTTPRNHNFDISVVVPTVGRGAILADTLSDLAGQVGVRFEVLVIDQDSSELPEGRRAAEAGGLTARCFFQSEPNASLARNVGLLEARAPIVLFIDDDMRIDNHRFLASHVDRYRDESLSGVFGQVLTGDSPPRQRPLHRFADRARVGWLYTPSDWTQERRVLNGTSNNLSVRRDMAIAVGGMDAAYVKGSHREESDFCLRLTREYGPLLFSPAASAVHLHAGSGGCRSWNKECDPDPAKPNSYARHHCAGEWYFIRKGLRIGTILWRDLPDHLFVLFRRQLWNRPNGNRFCGMGQAVRRSIEGFRDASAMLREGPRMIDRVHPKGHRLVWSVGEGGLSHPDEAPSTDESTREEAAQGGRQRG